MSTEVTHRCDHCQAPIPIAATVTSAGPSADSSAIALAVRGGRDGDAIIADIHICQSCIPHLASFLPGVHRARFSRLASYEDTIHMRSEQRVPTGHTIQMTANLTTEFDVRQIVLEHGENWAVNDILVGMRSQFAQGGDVPGDMFNEDVRDAFLSFDTCKDGQRFAIIATYIGKNPEGATFSAKVHGSARGFKEDSLEDSLANLATVDEKHTELPKHSGVRVRGRTDM